MGGGWKVRYVVRGVRDEWRVRSDDMVREPTDIYGAQNGAWNFEVTIVM